MVYFVCANVRQSDEGGSSGKDADWRNTISFPKRPSRDSVVPGSPGRSSLTRTEVRPPRSLLLRIPPIPAKPDLCGLCRENVWWASPGVGPSRATARLWPSPTQRRPARREARSTSDQRHWTLSRGRVCWSRGTGSRPARPCPTLRRRRLPRRHNIGR